MHRLTIKGNFAEDKIVSRETGDFPILDKERSGIYGCCSKPDCWFERFIDSIP